MAKHYKSNVIETHLEQIKDKKIVKLIKLLLRYILHTILIFIVFFMLNIAMKYLNGLPTFKPFDFSTYTKYYWFTFVIWYASYLILKGITGKTRVSLLIIVFVEFIFDMINTTVRNVRGSAITLNDIIAIPTAWGVASSVDIKWEACMSIATGLVVAICLWLALFDAGYVKEKGSVVTRLLRIVVGVAAFIVLANSSLYKEDSLWHVNYNYYYSGTPITIMRLMQNFKVKEPEGYNKNEVKEILASYENKKVDFFNLKDTDIEENNDIQENIEENNGIQEEAEENKNTSKDTPNIIVIVNESFSDYYSWYETGNSNPLEYFDELMEQQGTISGIMYSSAFGGETANVEFEFLTQNSLITLPVGSFPFQQYVSRTVKGCINTLLKQQGYLTESYHAWLAYAYSRNKIYKFFNFDNRFFLEDFEDNMRPIFNNKDYPTDSSLYEEVMRHIDEKRKGQKVFEYILTMQNHIGYQYSDPEMEVYHDDWDRNIYMQLLHASEDALKEFLDYLSKKDEKYIVLFFGDHQPKLAVIDDTNGKKYAVPFLIWANYDIPTKHNITTSTVFLQSILLEAAGVETSSMNNYMLDLYDELPVITKNFFMDKDLNYYANTEENYNKFPRLAEYNKISYYRIFDENKIKE